MGWQSTSVATGIFQVIQETEIFQNNNGNPQNIASGATTTFGPFQITQAGYAIAFGLSTQAAATHPFVTFDMQWSSSATGQRVARERWMPASGNIQTQSYYGTGPTKGDTLQVQVSNQDNHAVSLDFFSILGDSRQYNRDDWRQDTQPNSVGFTAGTYEQAAGILMATSPTVGATSNTKRLLPLYSGLVFVNFIPAGTNNGHFTINDEGAMNTSAGLAAQTLFQSNSNNNPQNLSCVLPRSVCSITLFNDGSSSGSLSAQVTVQEQPQ